MSELRRDPIVGRWVIVDTDSPAVPGEYDYEPHVFQGGPCPFCYGNEHMTPTEIDSIRDPRTAANTPGWQVRAVPNKYPALQVEGGIDRRGLGMFDMSNGIGAHEVIVDTPYHQKDIPELLQSEVEQMISMYCRRASDLRKDRRLKYVILFKNFGAAAGASLEHPHTQLIALPMVPKLALEEAHGAQAYFEYRERCIFCDIIRQELQEKVRIVAENSKFVAFCPFVSRFPFETWIVPKEHSGMFCQMNGEEISCLAHSLRQVIGKLKKLFPNLPYNYIIHTSPVNTEGGFESYHWHMEIMPKLTRTAGFEWGSGFYLVQTPPEAAAKYLRDTVTE